MYSIPREVWQLLEDAVKHVAEYEGTYNIHERYAEVTYNIYQSYYNKTNRYSQIKTIPGEVWQLLEDTVKLIPADNGTYNIHERYAEVKKCYKPQKRK